MKTNTNIKEGKIIEHKISYFIFVILSDDIYGTKIRVSE